MPPVPVSNHPRGAILNGVAASFFFSSRSSRRPATQSKDLRALAHASYWTIPGQQTKIACVSHTLIVGLTLLSVVLGAAVAAQSQSGAAGPWSGVIINSGCTADEAFAEAAKCTAKVPGTKLVLYDDTTRQMFQIEPQDKAAGHLGDAVTVRGTLDGETIRGASVELLTGIGLAVGQKAPVFSLRDQFGHQQTLDGLKGPQGTVLLFFRSADW